MPKRILTDEQEREIIALYSEGTPVREIRTAYNLASDSTIYRTLNMHGISLRTRQTEVALAYPEPVEPVAPIMLPTSPLKVTTDAEGFVFNVARDAPVTGKLSIWEVSYTSTMRVQAADIEDAIAQVRKLPTVKRVYSIRLKESMI